MRDVAEVINAAVVHDVHVIVVTPVAWPRLHDDEGIATVLEVRPAFDNLRMAHVEVVFTAEVRVETVIGDSPTSSVSRLLRALFLRIPALLPVLFLLFLLSFFLSRPEKIGTFCNIWTTSDSSFRPRESFNLS